MLPVAPCRCRDCAGVGCRSPRDLRKKARGWQRSRCRPGRQVLAPAQDLGPWPPSLCSRTGCRCSAWPRPSEPTT